VAEPKRCLVIGLGQIGAGYDIDAPADGGIYTHARAASLHPAFKLVGGVDPLAAQRGRFNGRYGVAAFASIAEAMEALSPHIVAIATPADTHLEHVREVLAAGRPEVLLCEKPLALSEADGEQLVRLCDEAGTRLFVNFIRRSEPGAVEVARRIATGTIQAPLKGAFWYSKGLYNNGSHFINLLQYWLGNVREMVVLDKGRRWAGVDPEPDVRLVFERGTVVLQAAREEAFSFYGGEFVSASGRLVYGSGGSSIAWQGVVRDDNFAGYSVLSPVVENIHNDMDRYQWHVYEQLSRCISGQAHELCSGGEALATLRVVSAIAGPYGIEF
jgi:predicted dehydrogenase